VIGERDERQETDEDLYEGVHAGVVEPVAFLLQDFVHDRLGSGPVIVDQPLFELGVVAGGQIIHRVRVVHHRRRPPHILIANR
jgi:hypothetical protein